MKKRNIGLVLLFSFITLGIYVIYWLYIIRKELLPFAHNKNNFPRVLWLFLPWLLLISLLLLMAVLTASMPDSGSTFVGIVAIFTSLVIFGGIIAGIIVSFWWFYRFFKGIAEVTGGTDPMLMYVLWILFNLMFGPIWTLLVQNDINKFIDNGYRPVPKEVPPQWYPPAPEGPAPQMPLPPNPYAAPYPQQQPYYGPAYPQQPMQQPMPPQAPTYYAPPAPTMPAPTVEQQNVTMHHPHTRHDVTPAHQVHHGRQETAHTHHHNNPS